jgi:excisionase family DNA binding protein
MDEVKLMPLLHHRKNAARILGVSIRLLDRLLAERELKSVRVGRRRLISESALQNYIRARERSGD